MVSKGPKNRSLTRFDSQFQATPTLAVCAKVTGITLEHRVATHFSPAAPFRVARYAA